MTISERVKNILAASQAARNSDKELLIIYMNKSGMDLSAEQEAIFRKMPSMETLRRIRQKWQEIGAYKADPKVEEARYSKFKSVRGSIGATQPEQVYNLVENEWKEY